MLPGTNVVFAGMLSVTVTAVAAVVVLLLVTTIVYCDDRARDRLAGWS